MSRRRRWDLTLSTLMALLVLQWVISVGVNPESYRIVHLLVIGAGVYIWLGRMYPRSSLGGNAKPFWSESAKDTASESAESEQAQ